MACCRRYERGCAVRREFSSCRACGRVSIRGLIRLGRAHQLSPNRHCERSGAAKQSRIFPLRQAGLLTWGFGVSRRMFSFLFDCCQLFVPTAGSFGWRAQIVSRSARRAAAKRLDLDASEHAIRLWWSGGCGADSSFSSGDLRFEPVFAIWFRVPDQTHIRSSRGRDCTNIPLAAGQAREDGTILRCGI
jgi:hypothetical protein